MSLAENIFVRGSVACVLKATGDDVFGFLQGQFTNQLRQAEGAVVYGLWLNQKGKVLADSYVLGIAEKEFLIVSIHTASAAVRQRLEDYIVADDVMLADETTGMRRLVIGGACSGEALERVLGGRPAAGRFSRVGELMVFPGRQLAGECFEVIGPAAAVEDLSGKLVAGKFLEVGAAEMEFARISAGIPAVPADLGPGDLPNEGGLDAIAVSYTKGCYLGQEVMARLKNLGQVRRRLHVVQGEGPAPAPLRALYQGDKKVGEVRSVAVRGDAFVALAMLSLVNFSPGTGLSLAPGGPTTLAVAAHG